MATTTKEKRLSARSVGHTKYHTESVREEEIGPAKAQEYLALNRVGNRHITRRRVEALARDMESLRFVELNGDTIKFTADGKLADGQHRLSALILAGKTYRFLVVRGVTEEAFSTIDAGKPRAVSDWLSMADTPFYVPHYHVPVASALRWVLMWDTYQNFLSKEVTTTAQRLEALKRYPGLGAYVISYAGGKSGLRMSASMLGACHFIINRQNKELAEEFMRALVDGLELKAGDPAHTVRQWIIRNRTSNTSNRFTQFCGHLILRAWNMWRRGEKVANIKSPETRPDVPLEK
jgi:hypothetical protein